MKLNFCLSAMIAIALISCAQTERTEATNFRQFNPIEPPTSMVVTSFQDGKNIMPNIVENELDYSALPNKPITLLFATGDELVLSDKKTIFNGAVLKAPAGAKITFKRVNGRIKASY
jgi:hypothetical protein